MSDVSTLYGGKNIIFLVFMQQFRWNLIGFRSFYKLNSFSQHNGFGNQFSLHICIRKKKHGISIICVLCVKIKKRANHMLISFDGFWLHSVTEFDSSQSIIVFNYFSVNIIAHRDCNCQNGRCFFSRLLYHCPSPSLALFFSSDSITNCWT